MKNAHLIIYPLVFIFSVVTTYLLILVFFSPNKPPKPIFLRVEGYWTTEVFNSLKKEFQGQNKNIVVEYEQKDPSRYYTNLKADLDKKTGPDLFWWHNSWGPLLKNNLAVLPDSIFSAGSYENTFYPITQTDMKLSGSYRGLPLEIDGLALLYNKSTFASLNLPTPSSSWSTIKEEDVGPLTSLDQKKILTSAIALGSTTNVENFPEILGLFLMQNGVDFIKNNQLTIAASPDSKGNNLASDAIDFYFAFSKKYKTWDNTQPGSIEAFARGKTAMILLPAVKIHKLLGYLKEQNLKLDFAVVPSPQLPNADQVSWGSYYALGVNQDSKEKEAAWDLANFLTSKPSLRSIFQAESKANDFGRAYPRVDMAREQTTNKYLAAYLVQAPYARSWYLNSDTFDKVLNDALIEQLKKSLARVENGDDGRSSLKTINSSFDPILAKFGLVNKTAAEPSK